MSPEQKASLVRECKRLRNLSEELNAQVNSLDQVLAAVSSQSPEENPANAPTDVEGLATVIKDAVIPSIREAVREELKASRPLDEAWYDPSEVEAMSCGKVRADTVRKWLRWGMIDGESDGRQIRLYQNTVEELRKNKWRPLRPPDPAKLPPSMKPGKLPIQPAEQ